MEQGRLGGQWSAEALRMELAPGVRSKLSPEKVHHSVGLALERITGSPCRAACARSGAARLPGCFRPPTAGDMM